MHFAVPVTSTEVKLANQAVLTVGTPHTFLLLGELQGVHPDTTIY